MPLRGGCLRGCRFARDDVAIVALGLFIFRDDLAALADERDGCTVSVGPQIAAQRR